MCRTQRCIIVVQIPQIDLKVLPIDTCTESVIVCVFTPVIVVTAVTVPLLFYCFDLTNFLFKKNCIIPGIPGDSLWIHTIGIKKNLF